MKTNLLIPTIFFLYLVSLASFSVIVKAQTTTNLTVTTDKQSYFGYDAVTISGLLQKNGVLANDGLIGVQVQDSKSNTLIIRTIDIGSTNPSMPIQINSAYLSDLSGQQVSTSQIGALDYFAINYINTDNTMRNMLVTINLYDSAGIPIGQVSEVSSLLAGTNGTAIFGLQIPSWAHEGVVHGFANAFTDWPSNGGMPISLERSFQFSITDGSKTSSNIMTSTGNHGSYTLTFRLPVTGTANAIYTVYTTSSIQPTSLKTSSFRCMFGDFNLDNIINYSDLLTFADAYIKYFAGTTGYNNQCDMNQDGKVNSQDFFNFASCYINYWSVS